MSDKHYVGLKAATINHSDALDAYTKVCIVVGTDDNNNQLCYFSILSNGTPTTATETQYKNKSGRGLEVSNPWGTQEIANAMLGRIANYVYKPFEASGAFLDDTAEIGDAVTVGGVYSQLVSQDLDFDSLSVSDISAPGGDETENEFGLYKSSTEKELLRRTNTITTKFTVEVGKIESEISDEDSALRSLISQRLDNITLSVSSNNGSSTFTLKDGTTTLDTETLNMTVKAANISGTLTANQINATNLHVNAANIDGTLQANQINATNLQVNAANVSGTLYASAINLNGFNLSDLYNDEGFIDSSDASDIAEDVVVDTVNAQYINALGITAQSLYAGTVQLGDIGTMTLTGASSSAGALDMSSYWAMRLQANNGAMYIYSGSYINLYSGSGDISMGGHTYPQRDNWFQCGTSGFRWTDVYATNATIQTSDLQKKKDVHYGLEALDTFFDGLRPCTYKFKDGHQRTHFGMIAQDIEQLIEDCGMSTMDVAAFIKSWNDETETYDYALRYGEFIPLLIWEVQQLKQKVKELSA